MYSGTSGRLAVLEPWVTMFVQYELPVFIAQVSEENLDVLNAVHARLQQRVIARFIRDVIIDPCVESTDSGAAAVKFALHTQVNLPGLLGMQARIAPHLRKPLLKYREERIHRVQLGERRRSLRVPETRYGRNAVVARYSLVM